MPDKMFLKKNAVCDIIDMYINTEVKACFKRNRLYIVKPLAYAWLTT